MMGITVAFAARFGRVERGGAGLRGAILALALTGLAAGFGATGTATAQEAIADHEARVGPVTNLPLPRYVSLRAAEGNARRGPGLTHRVDWVFRRRDMPLRVTAEFEHWRRVQDADGAGGWMHYGLLSGVRTVLVQRDMTALHLQADDRAPVAAYLEAGVVAVLQECTPGWCRIRADNQRGWAQKSALWGVDEGETFN